MKRLLFLVLLISSVFVSNCQKNEVQSKSISISENVSAATNTFTYKFWQEIDKAETPKTNYMVSPLSLHIALGMLLNGANADTKTEIQKVLGLENMGLETINNAYKELITGLPTVDPKVTNTIANAIFQEKTFTAEKEFQNTLSTYFSAKLFSEDFGNQATVNKINAWASDNTNKKITKIIDEINPQQVMFLLNALYFKGDWTNEFKVANTRKEAFAGAQSSSQVDMMYQTTSFGYKNTPESQIVELPYGNEKYAMYIILPKNKINTSLTALSNSNWTTLRDGLTKQKVIVGLPKFKIEYSKKLNEALQNLGMLKAFSNQADLSKIALPAGKLKVGLVKQDTYIAVDEKGTEAAAVTSIGIEVTSVPVYPEIICNKPFLFMVAERSSNTVLFVGKVAQF
jgi:serine protease inhibitor